MQIAQARQCQHVGPESFVLCPGTWVLGPWSLVLGPDRMCQLSKETVGGVGSNYEDIMSIMPRNRYCVDMLGPP